jgi:hypothetical protein
MATKKVTATTATPELPVEFMKLPEAFRLISLLLVNNDPTTTAEQVVESIRDVVSATRFPSQYVAPVNEAE